MQQRIDHVAPRAEFQQCLGEFQPDAREFVVVCGISYEFADPGAEGEAFGPGHFNAGEEEGAEVEGVVVREEEGDVDVGVGGGEDAADFGLGLELGCGG